MNIDKKTKKGGGGAVKTDKDCCPRNGPNNLQLFRAFDVFRRGHFVPNQVA